VVEAAELSGLFDSEGSLQAIVLLVKEIESPYDLNDLNDLNMERKIL
jgi:hypothetical protein